MEPIWKQTTTIHNATFYLGCSHLNWFKYLDVPVMVSRRLIHTRKSLPTANERWVLDSGGYGQLHRHGEWTFTPEQYAKECKRYADEMGNLEWVAPMDWMCEPSARQETGLSVAEHQKRTLENFLYLRQLLGELVIPVLQGWEYDDYQRCVDMFDKAGIDLTKERCVGLGSVCRRNAKNEICDIVYSLQPIRLHAFGVKGSAYIELAHLLESADSTAWSMEARWKPSLPECNHTTMNCRSAHCYNYATYWLRKLERKKEWHQQQQLFQLEFA